MHLARGPAASSAWWPLALALLVGAQLLLLLGFDHFPSQDGPLHIESASALVLLEREPSVDESPTARTYAPAWRFATNQTYHRLLHAFGPGIGYGGVEKAVFAAFVLAGLGALWFVVASVGGRPEAVLLGVPALLPFVLYAGFVNYCLALPVAWIALGVHLRARPGGSARSRSRSLVLLSALLVAVYLLHVFVLAATLVIMALITIAGHVTVTVLAAPDSAARATGPTLATRRIAALLRESGQLCIVVAPSLLLAVTFLASTEAWVDAPESSLLDSVVGAAPSGAVPVLTWLYGTLVTFSWLDLPISAAWHGVLLAAAVGAYRYPGSRGVGRTLGLSACVLLAALLVVPDGIATIHYFHARLTPFLYPLVIAWYSTATPPATLRRAIVTGAILVGGLDVAYRFGVHASLSRDVAEIVSLAPALEAPGYLLPVDFGPQGHGWLGGPLGRLRIDHAQGAAGLLTVGRDIVDIGNYQVRTGYFPIRAIADVHIADPFDANATFTFDVAAWEARTGERLDALLLWGDPARAPDPEAAARTIERIERDFEPVAASADRGLARLYRRLPDARETTAGPGR